jgi:TRAP-type C4-dicarboxylate transport system permease small subunit
MSNPSTGGLGREGPIARVLRNALTAVVAVVMFAMMMLTTIDVAARALLNMPVRGSYEIVTFLLAILVFASLPLVTWDEKHITVNLFDRWMRRRVRHLLDVVFLALSTVIVGVITWRLWVQGGLMAEGQHITGLLEWPIAPIAYFMSVLSALTTLILMFLTWQRLAGRETPPTGAPGSREAAGIE